MENRARQRHRQLTQHDERLPRDDDAGAIGGVAVVEEREARARAVLRVLFGKTPLASAAHLAAAAAQRRYCRRDKGDRKRDADRVPVNEW